MTGDRNKLLTPAGGRLNLEVVSRRLVNRRKTTYVGGSSRYLGVKFSVGSTSMTFASSPSRIVFENQSL